MFKYDKSSIIKLGIKVKANKLIYTKNAKIAICRKLLSEDTIFIDTETTGLDKNSEIVELTILDVSGSVLFNELIKPQQPITENASAIHGITNKMVEGAPSFEYFAYDIQKIISGKNVVGHNVKYDKKRLVYEFSRLNDIKFPEAKSWYCTMLLNIHSQNQKWPKLIELAEEHDICFEGNAHRSYADTEVCRKILHSIAQSTLGLEV